MQFSGKIVTKGLTLDMSGFLELLLQQTDKKQSQ